MKISRNWMRKYGGQGLDLAVADLVAKIGAQLGAVEEIIETGKRYEGIVVARVVSCADHPNADRLHVCKIDDGGAVQDVPRDEQGHIEVVCGAPNVREGLTVAWLPPGTTVPSTAEKDPFVLEAREIRGVTSNGMLASPKELALSDSHEGILEIATSDGSKDAPTPGTPFKQLYDLDDVVIDIENKMFTHRPDCFGQLGVAREIAGIQGMHFESPEWYLKPEAPQTKRSEVIKKVAVTNEVPDLCPRYMLVAMENITIQPSPMWLQTLLTRVGVRPINNVVDITNYLMLLTGQPLHAFDFDKVAKDGMAQIVVRHPKAGEKLPLLDGRTIEPRADAILICDQDKPIGMGGMMGGNNSEIDNQTKRILIECATFDMYNIRRSSMEHGIFTDAVTRFTKGQSPWQCPSVLMEAVRMVQELAPEAYPVGDVIDSFTAPAVPEPVEVSAEFINARLGLQLEAEAMATLLVNVEFAVQVKGDVLLVKAPFWRTDIDIPEDIVEEVGRLYGYDKLPLVLPRRDLTPATRNQLFALKQAVRDTLARAGANEVLTYSFVHGNLLSKVHQQRDQAFQLSNALSPDLQYYRLSLTPSLLEKVHPNIKAGYDRLALFELGKSHVRNLMDDQEADLPKELPALSLVVARADKADQNKAGAAYYQARKYLDVLLAQFQVNQAVGFELVNGANLYDNPWLIPLLAPYEPNRSAVLRDGDGLIWGVVGEFKASVRRALKLPSCTAGFELDPTLLLSQTQPNAYHPLPRFPKVEQDITLRVGADVAYSGLAELLLNELQVSRPDQTYLQLTPLNIYQKDHEHKNISFRLSIASYERTLTAEEVNKLLDTVAEAAHTVLQAERV